MPRPSSHVVAGQDHEPCADTSRHSASFLTWSTHATATSGSRCGGMLDGPVGSVRTMSGRLEAPRHSASYKTVDSRPGRTSFQWVGTDPESRACRGRFGAPRSG